MAAKKAAAISPSMEEDVELTQEEQANLQAQEAGEQPPPPEQPPEPQEPQLQSIEGGKPKAKKTEESVPYDRFEQVNERLRATESQLAQANEYRERWARLEERQRQAQEAAEMARQAEAAAKQAAERPDPAIDPVGARAWDAEQRAIRAEQRIEQLAAFVQQGQQQAALVNANNDMQNWLAFQVPQARTRFQDYDTRVDYARWARASWWASTFQLPDGRQVQLFSPDQARDITAREELVLLQRAKELGIPVADAVVRLSDIWGYPQWVQQQQAAAQQNGNGVRRAVPAQVMPSGNQRLEQIQRGQAVQGLGRVQSGETNQALAWQTMSNAEFKAFVGNMPEDQYVVMVQDPNTGKQFERRVGDIDLTDLTAA